MESPVLKPRIYLATVVAAFGLFFACSEESDPTDDPLVEGLTSSLKNLPAVTGFVVVSSETVGLVEAVSTFGEWPDLDWDTPKSQAMCFTGDVTRTVLSEAAGPDRILCKLAVLEDNGLLELAYDNTRHDFRITNLNDDGAETLHSIYGQKTGDEITTFKMYSCNESGVQDGYYSADITRTGSPAFASLRSVSAYEEGTDSGGQLATTSGSVDSLGNWTQKLVAFQSITESSTLSRTSSVSIDQMMGPDFTIYGSFYGSSNGTDEASCFWAKGELDGTDSLETAAFGDGAMKHDTNIGGQTCDGNEQTSAWVGSSREVLSDTSGSTFYTNAQASFIPTLATFGPTNVAFTGDDAWNCTVQSEVEIDLSDVSSDVQDALDACDVKFTLTRESADCQNAAQN